MKKDGFQARFPVPDPAALAARLRRPAGMADVILDTDTYNEIDDQFALAYLVRSQEKLRVRAITAAPFYRDPAMGVCRSADPADGMEKSYQEILKVLSLMGREDLHAHVFRGARGYLPSETEPADSPAARAMVELSREYSQDHPLYLIAIGAITNVASALLLDPSIADNVVIVWLGGHSLEWPETSEFNMMQDVPAARVVFGCGAPVVQLPCMGVVDHFYATGPELRYWLGGKNALCDYLVAHTEEAANAYAAGKVWSRVIWDVTAVGWLLNDDNRLMESRIIPAPLPQCDHHYSIDFTRHPSCYVWRIHRDALMQDLVEKLTR